MSEPVPAVCPICGAAILAGYGLAGGGIGPYWVCETDDCEWMLKSQEEANR